MTSYSAPINDIKFLYDHVLDFQKISQLPGYEEATPDLVDAILEQASRFYENVLSPTNKIADNQGTKFEENKVMTAPILDDVYEQFIEGGWTSLAFSVDHGGQGMPALLSVAADEMSHSANMAFSLCPMLSKGVVTALSLYGNEEQKKNLSQQINCRFVVGYDELN